MTDKPQPSHWESLAKELGAEVGPVEAPPRPLPAAPPARATRRTSEAPRPNNRPTADWSQLANELGATPSAESLKRSEPSIASRSEPARARPYEEPRPARAPEPRAAEPRREEIRDAEPALDRLDDERIEFEIEEADVASEFSAQSTSEEVPEGPPRDSERRGGRRRRRRRGRGKSAEPAPAPAREPEVWDVESAPARDEEIEEFDDTEISERPSVERTEAPARTEDRGRPRRRRRRRGGRRDGEAREPSVARADESYPDRADDVEDDEHAPQSESAAEPEHVDLDDDDQDLKANHRGIPTWDEAIGMIVGANMEARARNPSGSPGGSRGRRGHGRGRGHGR